jgi:hypothetical protein
VRINPAECAEIMEQNFGAAYEAGKPPRHKFWQALFN